MKKILIVDDEHKILMSLEYSFRKQNFEVFIARDGQEALEILENHTPDCILLDIMMPKVDGFTTMQMIKKNQRLAQCKVIFLSAKNSLEDIQKGQDLGADDYFIKPYSIKKLLQRVEQLTYNL